MDDTGAFRIDRSPKHFEPILCYLRHGTIHLDHSVSARGIGDPERGSGSALVECRAAFFTNCFFCAPLLFMAHPCFTGVLAEAHFFGLWNAVEELEPLARAETLKAAVCRLPLLKVRLDRP